MGVLNLVDVQGNIVTHLKKKIIMYPTEVLKFILALTMFLTRSNCLSVTDIFGTYLDDNSTDEVKKSDIESECHSASSGTGQCMFDLSCRLSYGHKVGDCKGFYQVCCILPDKLQTYHRQKRLLEYSGVNSFSTFDIKQPSSKDGKCGLQMTAAKRVIGGSDAQFGSFPWMALVKGGETQCGGALVGDRWVVTAGHCVRKKLGSIFSVGYIVILGEHTLMQNSEPLPRQKFTVTKVHRHPLYQQTPQADRFDVALLELDRRVTMMPHIQPVCLPSTEIMEAGVSARVAGWGAVHPERMTRPKVLQSVEVVTVNNKECEKWHWGAGIGVQIYTEMMCAGHREGGRDACQGDSGGPLMTKDPDTGVWTLIGLVSAGYSCAKPGQPGIYHRVSESVGWINYIMRTAS